MRNAKSGQACRQNESHRRDNVDHKDLNMHCLLYVHRDSVTNRYMNENFQMKTLYIRSEIMPFDAKIKTLPLTVMYVYYQASAERTFK